MTRLPLLDLIHEPPIRMPVDENGPTLQDQPDEVFTLPEPRMAWPTAEIELHLSRVQNLWMWSTSFNVNGRGKTYRVGEKWGKFARTRDDALHYARIELLHNVSKLPETSVTRKIQKWAETLK